MCVLVASCASDESAVDPWETVELGTDAEFRDIFFLDSQNGWIVGAGAPGVTGGIIGRTRDGGTTWQYRSGLIPKRYRSSSVDLHAIHFVDEMHGCIAAESGEILITSDGGENWRRVGMSRAIYAHLRDVHFVDTQNGWIVGRAGVLRTGDGGEHWGRVDEDRNITGESIQFLDLSHGWVVGGSAVAHRTGDGGATWERVDVLGRPDSLPTSNSPRLTSVHFADKDHGWITG